MKLNAKRGNGGHITSYLAIIGSKEARDVGFLDADGHGLPLKKTVDTVNHRIILELEDEAAAEDKE